MVDGNGSRVRRARKLLVASVGVASVNYAAIGCEDDGSIVTVANLMAPPYTASGAAGKKGQAGFPATIPFGGQGGRDGSSGAAGAGEGGGPEGGSAGGS